METLLKGDYKAELYQQVNLVGSCTIAKFTAVMTTMTVYIFPTYVYCDQLRKTLKYDNFKKICAYNFFG